MKHVELIGIINKQLLLHLVGCLYYCISDARSYKHQNYERSLVLLSYNKYKVYDHDSSSSVRWHQVDIS